MVETLRSPCYTCDIWMEHGSDYLKYCAGPLKCEKHRKYLAALGPAGIGTPDLTNKQATSEKVCVQSDCANAGKPQQIENFHVNKATKDGRQATCMNCQKKITAKRRLDQKGMLKMLKKKAEARRKESDGKVCSSKNCKFGDQIQPLKNFHKNRTTADGLNYQCKSCENRRKRNSRVSKALEKSDITTIDKCVEKIFADHGELLSKLEKIAARDFRTAANQLLYIVQTMSD